MRVITRICRTRTTRTTRMQSMLTRTIRAELVFSLLADHWQ